MRITPPPLIKPIPLDRRKIVFDHYLGTLDCPRQVWEDYHQYLHEKFDGRENLEEELRRLWGKRRSDGLTDEEYHDFRDLLSFLPVLRAMEQGTDSKKADEVE